MKNHYPNSLVNRVADAVIRMGTATLEDLKREFPEESAKKLHAALANARDRKRLRVKERGCARGGTLSVWEAGPHPDSKPAPKDTTPLQPIPSVWSLADRREWDGPWPPLAEGRRIDKLGPWVVPDELELMERTTV